MLGPLVLSVAALALPAPSVCFSTDETRAARGPTLQGDIDGDGRTDVVWTEAEWLDARHCRASLHVETAKETFAVAVEPPWEDGGLFAPPDLAGLVRLDRRPGLEIALVPWMGASTTFATVYALRAHRLVRLEGPLFGYGGSVMNRSGVDCARLRGALVVSTGASFLPTRRRYRVVRRFYALHGDAFALKFKERYRVREGGLLRFPELADEIQPFPSCTAVR